MPSAPAAVRPANRSGAQKIVAPCGSGDSAHTIRFLDANTENAALFITCLGAASGAKK